LVYYRMRSPVRLLLLLRLLLDVLVVGEKFIGAACEFQRCVLHNKFCISHNSLSPENKAKQKQQQCKFVNIHKNETQTKRNEPSYTLTLSRTSVESQKKAFSRCVCKTHWSIIYVYSTNCGHIHEFRNAHS